MAPIFDDRSPNTKEVVVTPRDHDVREVKPSKVTLSQRCVEDFPTCPSLTQKKSKQSAPLLWLRAVEIHRTHSVQVACVGENAFGGAASVWSHRFGAQEVHPCCAKRAVYESPCERSHPGCPQENATDRVQTTGPKKETTRSPPICARSALWPLSWAPVEPPVGADPKLDRPRAAGVRTRAARWPSRS